MKLEYFHEEPIETLAAENGAEHPTIKGVLLKFSDVATVRGQRLRFESGAFGKLPDDVILNLQHERVFPIARTPDVRLSEEGGELRISATLRTSRGRQALRGRPGQNLQGIFA